MTPKDIAEKWLSAKKLDEHSRNEIERLQKEDETGFVDAFYKDLEFGTGGLRGVMGVGSNRINKYTIGMATQGLANYLLKTFPNDDLKVAIAHDSRNNSRYFAETTANVFSANGITVFLFDDLRPTPELSFAIRTLKCQSGVVLTASHNPREYNGYKAYWNDGAQLIPPHDKNVIDEVKKIGSIDEVNFDGNQDLIQQIGEDLDRQYIDMLTSLSLSPDSIDKHQDMSIVFSGIHGTGNTLVPPTLRAFGFSNVSTVAEQEDPDGDFPTVVYPNPEEAEALSLALKKAEQENADLVMATDPDADRVGIAVRNLDGKFQLLNGNQTGSLLVYYLLRRWKENNKLTGKEFVVKTIVTSDLIADIAKAFDVTCYETLTGFKYIAELIRMKENQEKFIGGGEESYGYLIGDEVRDKDAVASCAMIAEMAAWAREKGQTLFELLIDISAEYGLYLEGLKSVTKKGKSGADEIKQMMVNFRASPPKTLDGSPITTMLDYQSAVKTNMLTGSTDTIELPKSNVLQFITEDGTKVSIRPSGTEPKIKFYFSVNADLDDKSAYFAVTSQLQDKINRLAHEIEG